MTTPQREALISLDVISLTIGGLKIRQVFLMLSIYTPQIGLYRRVEFWVQLMQQAQNRRTCAFLYAASCCTSCALSFCSSSRIVPSWTSAPRIRDISA